MAATQEGLEAQVVVGAVGALAQVRAIYGTMAITSGKWQLSQAGCNHHTTCSREESEEHVRTYMHVTH